MVRLYVLVAVEELLSVTVTTTLSVPAVPAAGVPEMAPVVELIVNPLGNPVADQV
jgi:hypothetical protein